MIRRVLACAALASSSHAPAAAATLLGAAADQGRDGQGTDGWHGGGFRPDDALTAGRARRPRRRPDRQAAGSGREPERPRSTIAQLDAQLVRGLGLLPAARQFTAASRAAGLVPTLRFGTEVVARLLGLRVDHPAAQDALELAPPTPATRAEAAYSAARILACGAGELDGVDEAGRDLRAAARRRRSSAPMLQTAISLVGYPYVWGGTSELPQDPFATGKQVPGRLRLLGLRLARLQAAGVRRRRRARRRRSGPHDLRDERRGEARAADRARPARARRPRLLRRARHALEAGRGRPHGHLPRRRLVHPVSVGGEGSRSSPRPRRAAPSWASASVAEAGC